MGPWSFADVLRDDIDAYISRCKEEARENGRTLPGQIFRDRLASRLGVTIRQLDRYCSGETMPDADKLRLLCHEIGANRAAKYLARECGVGVYDLFHAGEACLPDQVLQTARVLREVGQACAAVSGVNLEKDTPINPQQYRAIDLEIEQAINALEGLRGMLRVKLEEALRR